MSDNSAPLQIRIPPELKQRFDEVARRKATNKSLLIRNWIQEYVEENEKEEDL